MLPKIARLKPGPVNRSRYGLLICGLAILVIPTFYVQAQAPKTTEPPKSEPAANAAPKSDAKPVPLKSRDAGFTNSGAVRRAPLPAMAPPSVEFLPQTSEVEQEIEQKLSEQIEFDFDNQSLLDVCEVLRERYGVQCIIDRVNLEEESITTDATDITLKVSGISLRSALNLILKPKGLTVIVEDEVLKITTHANSLGLFLTRTYPVRDLVGNVDVDYQALSNAIQSGVGGQPDHPWMPDDGQGGTISALPATGALVIRQTARAHDKILQLLRAIRKANQEMQPKTSQVAPANKANLAGSQLDLKLLDCHVSDVRFYPLVGPARLATARIQGTFNIDGTSQDFSRDSSHLIPVN